MSRRGLVLSAALKFCAVRAGGAAVSISPRIARRLSAPIGDIACLLNAPARRQVRANLRLLQPHADARTIERDCRGVFRAVAHYYVELLSLPSTTARALEQRVDVVGYDRLQQLLAQGKGVLLTGIHCGPSELVMQALAARGVRYTAMVERLEPPPLNGYVVRVRESLGNRYVAPDLAGVKEAIRVLRAGGMVCLLVDRDVIGTGIPVRFCGHELLAPPGAIELAALTGAAVLPASVFWTASGRYEVTIQPPLYVGRQARKGDALRDEIERLLARFEPHLRAHPDQWLVLGPYWRG